mgnify:CR=1 FL=1
MQFNKDSTNKQVNVNKIISKTKNLTNNEKRHILNILLTYKVEYSQNQSGYFFYLEKINDEILDKILKCIDLIEEKSDLIYNLDKKRDEHLEYYKSLIENKLKETINTKKKTIKDNLRLIENDFYIIKKKSNKKVKFSNIDVDILMKEHAKRLKYPKDSIYYRISQVMVQLSRKNKYKHIKKNKSGEGYIDNEDSKEFSDQGEPENDHDNDNDNDHDDNIEENEEQDEPDQDEDYVNEYYNSDDEVSNASGESDTQQSEQSEQTGITEQTDHKIKKKTKISSEEFDYYKNLLKKGGFKFDDDKDVIMTRESYIE